MQRDILHKPHKKRELGSSKEPSSGRKPFLPLGLLPWKEMLFFAGLYLYVWLQVNPALRYHFSAPAFLSGKDFFGGFLSRPGGLLEYGAAFLAQWDSVAWLGTLAFMVLAWLIFMATRRLLWRLSGGAPVGMSAYLPPLLLLLLQNRYDSPVLELGLGLLAALGMLFGYLALPGSGRWLRLAVFWLMAVVLIGVAGGLPSLLFILLGGMFEWARRRQIFMGLGCWLSAVTLLPLGYGLAEFHLASVLRKCDTAFPLMTAMALYLFYPLAALGLALRSRKLAPAQGVPPRPKARAWADRILAFCRQGKMQLGFQLGLTAGAVALVYLTLDVSRKSILEVDYFATRHQWEQALAAAQHLTLRTASTRLQINRALFHTDRLLSDLFAFRQAQGVDLLPTMEEGLEKCRPLGETFLELGQVNLAEHFAHEAFEIDGDRPPILRLLVWVNVLKNRPQAARIFLNRLKRIPFQRHWAEARSQTLKADPLMSAEEDLAHIRPLLVTTDYPSAEMPAEIFLRQLLYSNRQNRMAFEYLMVYYLLHRQLEKLVQELKRLDDIGCPEIPRLCEEAILWYQHLHPGQTVDLRGRQIRPETLRRFARLRDYLTRNGGRIAGIEPKLAEEFGNTFWFYVLFGQTFGGAAPLSPPTNL